MATSGALMGSEMESDELSPFLCSPCARNDIDIGAEVYCTECEEYFCSLCLSDHNKFAKMAAHELLDRAEMEAEGPQRVQPVLTVTCDRHSGQVFTRYCPNHDQVCCAVCTRMYHKSCEVRYLLDVSKGTRESSELNDFKQTAKEIQTDLERIKIKRKTDIQRLASEKDRELGKIQTTVKQMIKDLEAIEKSAMDDVCRKYAELKTKIDSDLSKLDMTIKDINAKLDKLEKASDETEEFVYMKLCKEIDMSAKELVDEIQARAEDNITYQVDKRAEKSVRKLRSLGELVLDYLYSVTPQGEFVVGTDKDRHVCDVSDICRASDGSLMITDWENKCLKRLDRDCKVVDSLTFDDSPWGVCSVSTEQVAVTLTNAETVHLVNLGSTMTIASSFQTTDRCRGIVHLSGQLFITCGGLSEGCEGQGHVEVYTLAGELARKLETSEHGTLFSAIPLGVAKCNNDHAILVCDGDDGLVALGQDGQKLWTISCMDMDVNNVTRVSTDSLGQAFVSSYDSNKVVLVSKNGRKLGEVLTATDGIDKPQGLCVDTQHSRVMVGMRDCNEISVFNLA